jgi:hypothetical protein
VEGSNRVVKKEKDHAQCKVKKKYHIQKKQAKTAEIWQKTTCDASKTTHLQLKA